MRTVITRPLAVKLLEQLENIRHVDADRRRDDKPHGLRSHATDAPGRVLCLMPGPASAPASAVTVYFGDLPRFARPG